MNVLSIVRNTRIRERDAKRDAMRRNATASPRRTWRSSFAVINCIYASVADPDEHGTERVRDEWQRDSIKR